MEIPLAALFDNGRGPGVWTLAGNPLKTRWRPVRLARLGEETAVITAGLRPSERFVALGAHLLHQNQVVRIATDVAAR
jgi:hypothetical protein